MRRELAGRLNEIHRRVPRLDSTLARVLAGLLTSANTPVDLLLSVADWLDEAETQLKLLDRDRAAADLMVVRLMIADEAAVRRDRTR